MAAKKELVPPPRPPAPRQGFSSRGKTSSSSFGGISFKSLEAEDEEDLTTVTGKFDKQLEKERSTSSRDPLSLDGVESNDARNTSICTPPRANLEVNTVPMKPQNSFEKFSQLKDRIQDKIVRTIEEFSGDSSPSPENEGERTVSKQCTPVKKQFSDEKCEDLYTAVDPLDSVKEISKGEASGGKGNDYHEQEEYVDIENNEELKIVDEFFAPELIQEPAEDFTGLPTAGMQLRNRSKIKKMVNPGKVQIEAAAVSLSMLGHTQEQMLIDEPVSVESPPVIEAKTSLSDTSPVPIKTASKATDLSGIPVQNFAVIVIILFAYLIIPLPSYLSGMVIGAFMASAGWYLYLWLNRVPVAKEPFKMESIETLSPMIPPEMKEIKGENFVYKSWMNELMDNYNPDDYHVSQTHSIFVLLEGTVLRLRRPKNNIAKRAMWDELQPTTHFIHQRHYDLEGSRIFLLPPGLVKKRLWSKKYPICIALAKPGRRQSDSSTKSESSTKSDTVSGFEFVTDQKCEESVICLFARTPRDKEDWYKRLEAAAKGKPLPNHIFEINKILDSQSQHKRSSSSDSLRHKREGSSDSLSSYAFTTLDSKPVSETSQNLEGFVRYMSRLMPRDKSPQSTSPSHGKKDFNENPDYKLTIGTILCDPQLNWLNALIGRCFWDFLKDQHWANKVQEKLQKKLSKIHVPYFIEELQITAIDLGSEMPAIRRASKPYLDEDGLWADLDIIYGGGFKMTIETKVNLLKLKKPETKEKLNHERKKSAITDSEEEDSAESSTDEEGDDTPSVGNEEGAAGGSSGGSASRKILKYINKITQSKYFKHAAEIKYIKKAMEEVSNTPLVLTVEIRNLSGTLALNIPPPPSDRLWYGFRGNPRLWLSAKPKVGEREVTVTHITEWIEKKLALEFQRVLVMPNMDDLLIPILFPPNILDPDHFNVQPDLGTDV